MRTAALIVGLAVLALCVETMRLSVLSLAAEPLPGDADGCCGPAGECEACR